MGDRDTPRRGRGRDSTGARPAGSARGRHEYRDSREGSHRRGGSTPSGDRPARRPSTAPVIDDDVTGRELDKDIRQELATLAGPVAGTVARHLVMAGRLIDSDPELAHRHAQHARSMGGRVAVVREAAGFAAYAAGDYQSALTEFRAARRISGRVDFLPVMADCERGVGRPEKALELTDDPQAARLPADSRAELAIVAAGALRDLGRPEQALQRLTRALPARPPNEQWVARVQYALGDLLAELGRTEEAVSAFAAAEAGDTEGSLGAGDRVVELLTP